MRIFLVGMPAVGKSTFGRKLAQRLNYQFLDLDKWIEQETQLSINLLFQKYGESVFRKTEKEMLRNTIDFDNIVIATGGGTPCFFDNMRWIKQNGISIFLDTSLPLLAERIIRNPHRPLFQHKKNKQEVLAYLEQLYQARKTFYLQADFRITL
ncbi:MAG: shikimate kinase [Microscillaceae bacterium]|nr:shikimate kinase [Microscillaceae bacterium]MDW8461884.1 shikimate kinase [Cytophagales bacterium]